MPLPSAESIQVKHGEHGAVQNAQGLQLGEGQLIKPIMKPQEKIPLTAICLPCYVITQQR